MALPNETAKFSILLKTSLDENDPDIVGDKATKLVAKALDALAAKLDADATVTDTNYQATIAAVTV